MALKVRKRIRVFPGFYLNLSKSGMSATVGMRGMNVNIGKKGTYLNIGIPGTDTNNRIRLDKNSASEKTIPIDNEPYLSAVSDDTVEIKSYQPELITSEGLFGLKESIINAQKVKEELRQESNKLFFHKVISLLILSISYLLIIGFFIKWFRDNYDEKNNIAKEAKENYKNFKLDIEFDLDQSLLNEYLALKNSFERIMNIDTVWDITSAKKVDRVKERSAEDTSINRTKVKFSKSLLDFINTQYEALEFQNANGGDLYLYPGFIVMLDKYKKEFALIDFRDIKIEHHEQRFIEAERVPSDSKIVDRTWKYVNKNGMPDKRFKDNHVIPITVYYELTLETSKGLYEAYQFSNAETGEAMCKSFANYKNLLQKMKWGNEEEAAIIDEKI